MKNLKTWGLVALLTLLVLEVITIAPKKLSGPPESPTPTPTPAKVQPSQVATMSQNMHGVHSVGTSLGRKEWELDSDDAQGFKEKGPWQLQGVRVKFFSVSGTTYTVHGNQGTVQTETKDMHISGNVVTSTSDGYEFKTKSIQYIASEKLLTTPEEVEIDGPKADGVFQVKGRGFRASVDQDSMDLAHDVHAVKAIKSESTTSLGGLDTSSGNKKNDYQPDEKVMNIKSEKSHLNGKTSAAHFEGRVQVDIDAIRMTGNMADFLYDPKSHSMTSLVMQGNVRVTDQEHWASSQYAQVLFKENQFILHGNPRVTQNGNELRGEEIRFLNGGKEVQVLKAKAKVNDQGQPGADQYTKGFGGGLGR